MSMDDFDLFWSAFPRRIGKKAARKAWDKATDKPAIEVMLKAIDAQRLSEQWRKDNGQFIPHPVTWLNQGRWDDEVEIAVAKPVVVGPSAYQPAPKIDESNLVPMPPEVAEKLKRLMAGMRMA